MIELISATAYALALSIAITIGMGFVYYTLALGMMNVARRVWGEGHRGYYLLNLAVVAMAVTFLLLFAGFARSF